MTQTMMAAVYESKDLIRLRDVPIPELKDILAPRKDGQGKIYLRKDDLAVVRVDGASICGTDVHILSGQHASAPPVILGHEFVGTVVEMGQSVTHCQEGDFVAVDPNIKCGECEYCRKGQSNMCVNLTTLGIFTDGGFAQYCLVPGKQLITLPDTLPFERAIFSEAMSCVMHGLAKVDPGKGEDVLVIGAGPMGVFFAITCKHRYGCNVTMVEMTEFRRDFAERLGLLVFPNGEDFGSETFDTVINASGSSDVVAPAFEWAKRNGKVLLFGQQDSQALVPISPYLLKQKELQIFGSYAATQEDFLEATKILSDPRIPFETLITHRVALQDILQAFEAMKTGEAMKVLVTPTENKEVVHRA